jgi:hypothetical protein
MRILIWTILIGSLFCGRSAFSQAAGTVYTLEQLEEASDLIAIVNVSSVAPIVRKDKIGKGLENPRDWELGSEYVLEVSEWLKTERKRAKSDEIRLVFETEENAHSSPVLLLGRKYMLFLSKALLDKEKFKNAIVIRRSLRDDKDVPTDLSDIPEFTFNIAAYYKVVGKNWGIVRDEKRIQDFRQRIKNLKSQKRN